MNDERSDLSFSFTIVVVREFSRLHILRLFGVIFPELDQSYVAPPPNNRYPKPEQMRR